MTGDLVVNFENKMLVPRNRWQDNFLSYLRNEINTVAGAVYFRGGVTEDATIDITSSVNDTFGLDLTNASRVADGLGHIIDLSDASLSSLITDYPFENSTGQTYAVAIRFASVADTVERNPRTSLPQYVLTEDTIGELGEPDSVTDNSTFIRLNINTLVNDASTDHSGRPVKVWLKTPVSPDQTIAFYTGTITTTGGNHVIDIPYTVAQGPLGQTAPEFPISTDQTQYQVHIQGPSWFRTFDPLTDPTNYVFIGIITGNGPAAIPTVFDTSDQNTVFIISLDRAYRAATTASPAAGRTIQVDDYAVRLEQSATSQKQQDPVNAALHFDKGAETIDAGVGQYLTSAWDNWNYSRMNLKVAADAASGGDLQPIEDVKLVGASNQITTNRGAANPSTYGDDLLEHGSGYILISGSAQGQDGLYRLLTAGTTSTVEHMDGSAVSWTDEPSVNATFYVATEVHTDGQLDDPTHHGRPFLDYRFPASARGVDLMGINPPGGVSGGEDTTWLRMGFRDGAADNQFFRSYLGRFHMRGGAAFNDTKLFDGELGGHAAYQVDKRVNTGMATSFRPVESKDEWGFDYRGTDFGKYSSSTNPGYQLAASFRVPWTDYAGGSQNIRNEEPFTTSAANEITLTRVGADNSAMPAGGKGKWVLAEIQFDTPQTGDGVYWVLNAPSTTRIIVSTFDNSSPSFSVPQDGVVRFYGGTFVGPYQAEVSGHNAFGMTITQPTDATGGLRIQTRAATGNYSLLITRGLSEVANTVMAVVNDEVYADKFTTSGLGTTNGSDSVTTSLLFATSVDLDASVPHMLTLPTTLDDTDIVERNGGGSWTITRVLNRFDSPSWSGLTSGVSQDIETWTADRSDPLTADFHETKTGANTQAVFYKAIHLPHGATLTQIQVRVNPVIGDGTADAFGVGVRTKVYSATSGSYLLSTGGGFVRASGGSSTLQTVSYTADQNNTIDNELNEYWLILEKSDTGSSSIDSVYGMRVIFTVSTVGQSWFDAV